MKFKNTVLATLVLLGLATGVYAADNTEFIRFKEATEANSGGLEIAVTDYVSSGTTVTLYGVVHVADPEYYKKVQEDLDKFDVVLYEGVKTGSTVNQETKVLNLLQKLMGSVLNLKFQKDSIDYKRKNLVHADITMDELQKSLKGEHLTPLGQYVNTEQLEGILDQAGPFLDGAGEFLQKFLKDVPQVQKFQNGLKSQLAQQLANADISEQMSADMRKAIVLDRNKIVIDTFLDYSKKNPDKKTYAVFYGAAHMPDLEARLKTLGFEKKSKRWMAAWKVSEVKPDEDDEDATPPAPRKEKEPQDRQEDK